MVFEETENLRNQSFEGFRTMADVSFHDRRKLTKGLMKFRDEEQRVVTKPVFSEKRRENSATATAFGRDSDLTLRIG